MHGRSLRPSSLAPKAEPPSPLHAGIEALLEAERLAKVESGLTSALVLARAALRQLVVATLLDSGKVSVASPEQAIWEEARQHELLQSVSGGDGDTAGREDWFERFVVSAVGDVALADVPAPERPVLLSNMIDLARRLAGPLDSLHNAPRRRARRRKRLRVLLGVMALILTGVGLRFALAPENLARGKRVTLADYTPQFPIDPQGLVDGDQLNVGFHSNLRHNASVTIDLGSVQSISRIEVFNRPDCCQERAVPINVQTSIDGKEYVTVRREEHTFYHMTVRLPGSRPARYVRLLRSGRAFLHLSEVEVY